MLNIIDNAAGSYFLQNLTVEDVRHAFVPFLVISAIAGSFVVLGWRVRRISVALSALSLFASLLALSLAAANAFLYGYGGASNYGGYSTVGAVIWGGLWAFIALCPGAFTMLVTYESNWFKPKVGT